MNSALLILGMSMPVFIAVVAAGVLLLGSVVYGFVRKFMRMAWTSWQIIVIFALTLLLKFIPTPSDIWGYAIGAGVLFGATAIVLFSSALIRNAMLQKKTRSNAFIRFCDRFLGGLTAALNWAMIAAVLGGLALGFVYYYGFEIGALNAVYAHPLWTDYASKYVFDLFIVTMSVFFLRGGYRIGLLRSIQTLFTLGLTIVAALLSLYLTLTWGFLRNLLTMIANSIAGYGLNIIASTCISYFITAFICFSVLFIAVILIGLLVNWLVKKFRSVRPLGVIDGAIFALVFYAFFLALGGLFNYLVYLLATGGLEGIIGQLPPEIGGSLGGIFETVQKAAESVARFFASSPLGYLFYQLNPFRFFIPLP